MIRFCFTSQLVQSKVTLALFITTYGFSCIPNTSSSSSLYGITAANANPLYVSKAQEALRRWNIDLTTTRYGQLRNMGGDGRVHNPPNWITVASSDVESCSRTLGVFNAQEICKEALSYDDIVGYSFARVVFKEGSGAQYPGKAWIIDTTTVIDKEYLQETRDSEAAIALFVHEIGHALGLQHWGNEESYDSGLEPGVAQEHVTHIMYPFTHLSTRDTNTQQITTYSTAYPNASELAAVKAVYNGMDSCSQNNQQTQCINPATLPQTSLCSNQGDEDVPAFSFSDYKNYFPCYYKQIRRRINNKPLQHTRMYHRNFPEFTISASIGNAFTLKEMPPPGRLLEDATKVVTTIHLLRKNNSEKIIYKYPRAASATKAP